MLAMSVEQEQADAQQRARSESPEREAKPKKSCKRTCTTCGYTWIDKYGKPQCPKCFRDMTDGYSFLDTALGQAMMKAMEEVKRKQREEEKRQRTEIKKCIARGTEKSRKEWYEFRSGLRALMGEDQPTMKKSQSDVNLAASGPLFREGASEALLASVFAHFSADGTPTTHWKTTQWRLPSRNWDK